MTTLNIAIFTIAVTLSYILIFISFRHHLKIIPLISVIALTGILAYILASQQFVTKQILANGTMIIVDILLILDLLLSHPQK